MFGEDCWDDNISKNGMKATVSFEYIMEPNILHGFRGYKNGKRQNCPTDKEKAEAEFILYDTGWRLKD